METTKSDSKAIVWTGRGITIFCVLFLVVDAVMKIIESKPSMEGTVQLDWPASYVQAIGVILLIATVLYAIPRTAVIGAMLLSAYLGGATAIMVRADIPYFFPIMFGILVWIGLVLKNRKVRSAILSPA